MPAYDFTEKIMENKKNSKENSKANNGKQPIKLNAYQILLIAVLIIEVTVFNYRFWCGVGSKPIELQSFNAGSGVEVLDNGRIRLLRGGDRTLEFTGINEEIRNIYIDIYDVRAKQEGAKQDGIMWDFQKLPIVVAATDAGNSEYFEMPERFIVGNVERTKYVPVESSGVTDKIRLRINGSDEQTVVVNRVEINKQVPFSFNILRIAFVYAVFVLIYLFRRGSRIYSIPFKWDYTQRCIVLGAIIVNIIIASMICFTNRRFAGLHIQYHELAQSFLDGRLDLEEDPPSALAEMENPYDKGARDKVLDEAGQTAKWDCGYYNGRYYVYFGALPVLIYYLPYLKETGEEFPPNTGVFINVCVFIVFAYLLMKEIIERWFKTDRNIKYVPFAVYMLLCQIMVFSSGTIFELRKADQYSTPITMGLALVTMGLYFWISSYKASKPAIGIAKMAAGSLCVALVAGCRPQYLIAGFLAIPLFWNDVFKDRTLFSTKSVPRTFAFLLPVIAVAAVVMWYNNARFGSPFDFGANYNLTTNDMTHRGFKIDRIGLGVFAYFVQPPNITPRFPFVTGVNLSNYYGGVTIMEFMVGGIFATHPILWLCGLIKTQWQYLKGKGLHIFSVLLIVFSVIVGIMDAQMAGILCRYYSDFTYLSIISAAFMAFALCEKYSGKDGSSALAAFNIENISVFVAGLCFVSFAFDFASMFALGDYGHEWANPDFFYGISSALTFWM